MNPVMTAAIAMKSFFETEMSLSSRSIFSMMHENHATNSTPSGGSPNSPPTIRPIIPSGGTLNLISSRPSPSSSTGANTPSRIKRSMQEETSSSLSIC